MKITVEGPDEFGNAAYEELFQRILLDLGKGRGVDAVRIVQRPEDTVFIYSVKLRSRPETKVLSDVADLKEDGPDTRLVIKDEVYAPALLSLLWERYRRDRVDQQTRYDIIIRGVTPEEIQDMEVFSGEKVKNEIIDAIWRSLPEGMKARHNITTDNVITILATEQTMTEAHKEEARRVHEEMRGEGDV